jgi:hypothetical protein
LIHRVNSFSSVSKILHNNKAAFELVAVFTDWRSKAEFISKLGVVVEEADETFFWLEFLVEIGIIKPNRLDDLRAEAKALVAIFVASRKTARS